MGNIIHFVSGITGGGMGAETETFGYFLIAYFAVIMLSSAYSVAAYVLHALGLFTVARRREIRKPWLAWIPVADVWILGSISDQYQYVVKGKVRNRRKTLVGLYIAVIALMITFYISYFVFIFSAVGSVVSDSFEVADILVPSLVMLGLSLAMLVVAVIYSVKLYIAYYDLFVSCRPNGAVALLVLGIIFGFLMPFFVFICRKKDLGMPPRKAQLPQQPAAPAEPEVQIIDTPAEESEEPTEE